jgi:hypothetical protein
VIIALLIYSLASVLIVLLVSGIYCGWVQREKLGIVFFLSAIGLEFVIGCLAHFGGAR